MITVCVSVCVSVQTDTLRADGVCVRTQVDIGQHPVQELRLHAVRGQEVGQQLTVTELWVQQELLHTGTHTYTGIGQFTVQIVGTKDSLSISKDE